MIHWGNVLRLCIALLTILGIAAFMLGPRFPNLLIFVLAGAVGVTAYTIVKDQWPRLEGWTLAIGFLTYLLAYWLLEGLAVKVIRVGMHVTHYW